jgi:hypothetical protein
MARSSDSLAFSGIFPTVCLLFTLCVNFFPAENLIWAADKDKNYSLAHIHWNFITGIIFLKI